MKSYSKSQLAALADVSVKTLVRWMKRHQEELECLGVFQHTKVLPPIAVKYVCEMYGIDVEES